MDDERASEEYYGVRWDECEKFLFVGIAFRCGGGRLRGRDSWSLWVSCRLAKRFRSLLIVARARARRYSPRQTLKFIICSWKPSIGETNEF